MMRLRSASLKAIVAAAGLAAGLSAASAEPLRIRLSFIVPVANWATMLFKTPGLARHLDKSYTFQAVHYNNTTSLPIALAANELEIANFGFSSLPIAINNAGMSDLRIIASQLCACCVNDRRAPDASQRTEPCFCHMRERLT